MPFTSFSFAVFFVITASLYHLAPRFGKNALLIQQILLFGAGLVFYAFASLHFIPFLLYVIAVSYLAGLFAKSRVSLAPFIIADLMPLLFFKYAPHEQYAHWIFPLGLSFFTFQSISYIADVYQKKIAAERNPLMVAMFVGFFPTITSGPVQRAGKLIPQLKVVHRFDYDNATDGMKLFAWGMFKKLMIADRIALYVDYVYSHIPSSHGLALLLATVLYSFQIYCDFSGYSDMAIGVARYFGFDAGRNFDHPYLSQSVGEFWRRWHISLSSWLRDYIYIPLGGSRVTLPRIYLNLMITFLVSGVWHGTGWCFIAWGLIHGLYQCVGRAIRPLQEKLRIPATVKVVITFCLVSFAWIFFRAENLGDALHVIQKITSIPSELVLLNPMKPIIELKTQFMEIFALASSGLGLKKMAMTVFLLMVFIIICFMTRKKPGIEIIREKPIVLRFALYFTLIIALYLCFGNGYSSNFIYQNF